MKTIIIDILFKLDQTKLLSYVHSPFNKERFQKLEFFHCLMSKFHFVEFVRMMELGHQVLY